MNPRLSVILLTTLIGAGQGLFIALFVAEIGVLFDAMAPPIRPWFFFYGALLAFVVTTAGLVASIFHLGRPARAWRSATQWRTSWLSREVIVLPAFLGVVLLYAAAQDRATHPRRRAPARRQSAQGRRPAAEAAEVRPRARRRDVLVNGRCPRAH